MTALAPDNFAERHLVVFGAGYLGAALARKAAARGARVTALTRNAAMVSPLAACGCDVVVDELSSPEWHGKISRADWVVDCVGSGGGGAENYRKSYVEGMRSILAWTASSGGADTLVYTSSTSVYPQDGGKRVDESAATGDTVGIPAILLEAESLLRAGGAAGGCRRWFILRLAGLYGPGRHRLLDQLRAGEPALAGSADQRLNLIHRDDAVAAILAALAAPDGVADELFNVADDAPASRGEVAGWLADQLGRAAPAFTGEAAPGRRANPPDRWIANDRIKARLGWSPRHPDFRSGYRALLEA